jgi:hypothetical protein
MVEIWKHLPGYSDARDRVQAQTLEEDLRTLDDLFGRGNLRYGATPDDVKQEALKQIEEEFRDGRNENAEFFVMLAQSQRR